MLLITVLIIYLLILAKLENGDFRANKKKGYTRRTGTKRQIHETKVNVSKGLDARPRKASLPIRSKKVVPWGEQKTKV